MMILLIALLIVSVFIIACIGFVLCRKGNVEWDLFNEEYYEERQRLKRKEESRKEHKKWEKEQEKKCEERRKEEKRRKQRNLELLQEISDSYTAPDWALKYLDDNTQIRKHRGDTAYYRTAKVLQYYKNEVSGILCPVCGTPMTMETPAPMSYALNCTCGKCGLTGYAYMDECWWEGRVDAYVIEQLIRCIQRASKDDQKQNKERHT